MKRLTTSNEAITPVEMVSVIDCRKSVDDLRQYWSGTYGVRIQFKVFAS